MVGSSLPFKTQCQPSSTPAPFRPSSMNPSAKPSALVNASPFVGLVSVAGSNKGIGGNPESSSTFLTPLTFSGATSWLYRQSQTSVQLVTYLRTPTSFFQKLNSFTSTSLLTASSTPGCPLTSLSSSIILIPTAPPRTSASTFLLTSFSVPPPILCLPALTLASTVVCTITSRRIRRCNNNASELAR
jgi:hypothetical protein